MARLSPFPLPSPTLRSPQVTPKVVSRLLHGRSQCRFNVSSRPSQKVVSRTAQRPNFAHGRVQVISNRPKVAPRFFHGRPEVNPRSLQGSCTVGPKCRFKVSCRPSQRSFQGRPNGPMSPHGRFKVVLRSAQGRFKICPRSPRGRPQVASRLFHGRPEVGPRSLQG